jgi:aquaporin Z
MSQRLSVTLSAEFVGTFALVFIGAGVSALGTGGVLGTAIAHGLVTATMTYSFGSVSGGHFNPALSIAAWVAGAVEARRAIYYSIAQSLAAILAAFTLRYVLGEPAADLGATRLASSSIIVAHRLAIGPFAGFVLETILTFLFAISFLACAIGFRAGNLSGLVVGASYSSAILLAGPLTGGSLNPARTLGPAIVTQSFSDLWLYLAGPVLGAWLAALLFRKSARP